MQKPIDLNILYPKCTIKLRNGNKYLIEEIESLENGASFKLKDFKKKLWCADGRYFDGRSDDLVIVDIFPPKINWETIEFGTEFKEFNESSPVKRIYIGDLINGGKIFTSDITYDAEYHTHLYDENLLRLERIIT